MQICISLQTGNHASTPPLKFFTGRMPFLPPNQQRHYKMKTNLQKQEVNEKPTPSMSIFNRPVNFFRITINLHLRISQNTKWRFVKCIQNGEMTQSFVFGNRK